MTDTATGRKQDAQEPSMDDILASIRRILAEDGAAEAAEPAGPGARAPAAAADEPTPVAAAQEAVAEWADDEALPPAQGTVAAAVDDAFASAPSSPTLEEQDGVFMLSPDMRADANKLVSPRAADDSTDVLSQLARAILDRRDIAVATRDVTLESMVREMLRPLLREWLDRNLPYLIERLVKKEIDLMVNRAERLED